MLESLVRSWLRRRRGKEFPSLESDSSWTTALSKPDRPGPCVPEQDTRSQSEMLHDIQSLTDAALAGLDPQGLLDILVARVRRILHADTAAVLLLDASSSFVIAMAASGLEEEVNQGSRIPMGKGFAGKIAAEDRPLILTAVDHSKVVNPLLLSKGVRSLMGAPLRSGGTVLGVLHVGTLTPRTFSSEDVDLLQVAADRAASAVQALTSQLDRTTAAALQRTLLPSALPRIPGLAMAARFVPGRGNVGGDWYDVFVLPSGQACAMIGDVAGSGLRAAATMGRMRSTLRAYALETADPAEMLHRLERKMAHFEPDAMATVLCAVFSPDLSQVQISNAGHLPPLIAFPGQTTSVIPLPADTLIGAASPDSRRVTTIEFPAGALLCLYTDGLVERRDLPVDDGIAHLCKAVKPDQPETCCAAAMAAMADVSAPGDDVALLVLLRTSANQGIAAVGVTAGRPDGPEARWHGRNVVLAMPEEIDATNAAAVHQLLASVAGQSAEIAVADLTSTVFCDSAGLNSIIRARREILAAGGELRLAIGGSAVRRIVELSGIDQLMPILDSVEQALEA
jgi:phosphoserine phosphatase RsbU/P